MSQAVFQNRKLIAGIAIAIVLIAGASWGSVSLNSTKNHMRESLERAEFFITDVDILNFTGNSVFFNITGTVENLILNGSNEFEVLGFKVILNYNTTPVEITIDPKTIELPSESNRVEFSFVSSLDFDQLQGNGSDELLGAIISARHVDIPFQGIIQGRTLGIKSELVFLNEFKFRTSRTLLFNVTRIENPVSSGSKESMIDVEITNPFSGTVRVAGQIEVGLGENKLGQIPVEEPLSIIPGETGLKLPFMLHQTYAETMQAILVSTNFTIWARGDLQIFGSTDSLNTTAIFTVGGENGSLPLDWKISGFSIENYDPLTGDGIVLFNLTVINNLPIDIPIEHIEMELATLTGTVFTTVVYNGTRVIIPLYGNATLQNVTGILKGVNAFLIGRISEDGAISVPAARVVVFTEQDSFEVIFSIPRIELNIIIG
ncbi:MAG: hypothetical protein D6732_16535 [Methanobacteriota archaeon]|nr:MAG: hypothetical protein D6732_16535 [Euryarchaeota archaeon]